MKTHLFFHLLQLLAFLPVILSMPVSDTKSNCNHGRSRQKPFIRESKRNDLNAKRAFQQQDDRISSLRSLESQIENLEDDGLGENFIDEITGLSLPPTESGQQLLESSGSGAVQTQAAASGLTNVLSKQHQPVAGNRKAGNRKERNFRRRKSLRNRRRKESLADIKLRLKAAHAEEDIKIKSNTEMERNILIHKFKLRNKYPKSKIEDELYLEERAKRNSDAFQKKLLRVNLSRLGIYLDDANSA